MAERKKRSDAQQNRERILVVAKEAFAKAGANASLDDIAKQAGVGPGTLYRHFPSREDLLKAVYQAAAEKLATAATEFAAALPPIDAYLSIAVGCRVRAGNRQAADCWFLDRKILDVPSLFCAFDTSPLNGRRLKER